MNFIRYESAEAFGADTLEILSEHEMQNNLLISFILGGGDKKDWFFAAVKDGAGSVLLSAAWTGLPFNIVLYETNNKPNDAALTLMAAELKGLALPFPGVLAEQGLARRFAQIYAERQNVTLSMNIMRLDKVIPVEKSPGFARPLTESDLFFVPYWERIFCEDCHVEVFDIPTNTEQLRQRLADSKQHHLIWEDGFPVSQAAHTRSTQNGAVVNWVYTPPHYRGKGYASSVVAELSCRILEEYKFCGLFADAANPISCGIYRKLGYYDLCVYDSVTFEGEKT
ncbi:MAG: GNAT family N-acetyltransferase [Oscillospiraceae bacterium]|nr:GNAT family N-acetyltransferase [Oscillospiraceae bacterium]